MATTKIKDVGATTSALTGAEKIPMSDGSNTAVAVTTEQINDYIVGKGDVATADALSNVAGRTSSLEVESAALSSAVGDVIEESGGAERVKSNATIELPSEYGNSGSADDVDVGGCGWGYPLAPEGTHIKKVSLYVTLYAGTTSGSVLSNIYLAIRNGAYNATKMADSETDGQVTITQIMPTEQSRTLPIDLTSGGGSILLKVDWEFASPLDYPSGEDENDIWFSFQFVGTPQSPSSHRRFVAAPYFKYVRAADEETMEGYGVYMYNTERLPMFVANKCAYTTDYSSKVDTLTILGSGLSSVRRRIFWTEYTEEAVGYELKDGSVFGDKIADGSVDENKLTSNIKSRLLPYAKPDISFFNDETDLVEKLIALRRTYNGMTGSSTSKMYDIPAFVHLSDIHGNTNAVERVVGFLQRYSDYVSFAIHTGDSVSENFSNNNPFSSVDDAGSILNVIGNHDVSSAAALSDTDVYDKFVRDYVAGWGVTQPADASTGGLCYYYKDIDLSVQDVNYTNTVNGETIDNTPPKLRIIVLDAGAGNVSDWAAEHPQRQWLSATLADARTNGIHVLIASHYRPRDADSAGASLPTNFDFREFGGDAISVPTLCLPKAVESEVAYFVGNGGKFVAYIGGHSHADECSVLDGRLCMLVSSMKVMSMSQYDQYHGWRRNTRGIDCFNIYAVDTVNSLFKVMRVGRDRDRYLRKIDTFCWDYNEGKIVEGINPAKIAE